jgi:predicted XRE-type DNA-binding protein
MKAKVKVHTARNAKELVEILGLDPADAIEIEFRAKLNKKIIDAVKSQKLTHAEVAKRSKASRTRVTAILNGNTSGMSTDLLLRIIYSLGYKTKLSFARTTKLAA